MSQSQQENMIGQFGKDEAEFWNELFLMADENNVTIVTAAGNQNIIVGLDPMSRSSRSIKVAATDNSKQKAFFSNYFSFNLNNGSCLSAPGSNIYSSAPNGGFIYESGTSMASPLVAGIVALMKSVNKNISNKNIMRILHETGVKTNGSKIGAFVQADKAVLRAKNL
jgi:subtilisin family serine protease